MGHLTTSTIPSLWRMRDILLRIRLMKTMILQSSSLVLEQLVETTMVRPMGTIATGFRMIWLSVMTVMMRRRGKMIPWLFKPYFLLYHMYFYVDVVVVTSLAFYPYLCQYYFKK